MTDRPFPVAPLEAGPLRTLAGALPCRVTVIELPDRVVLVDAGFSAADLAERGRFGVAGLMFRPPHGPDAPLAARLRARGIDPADVSDVVLTHLDFDHASGILDVPQARIHVGAAELAAQSARPTLLSRLRYRAGGFRPAPRWVAHPPGPDTWEGLDGVTPLDDVAPGLRLVPLPGHTAGHCGVLVPTADGPLLQVGDAAHSRSVLESGATPAGVRLRQRLNAHDPAALTSTRRRLERLLRRRPDLTLLTAHGIGDEDPRETPAPVG